MIVQFSLNGEAVTVRAEPDQRLIDLLRDSFGLLSVKRGCLKGTCGSCTVLMNEKTVPSCMIPVFVIRGQRVVTLEGFSKTWDYVDIERGFLRSGVRTCGHCVSGKVLSVHSLLEEIPDPAEQDILNALSGVRCRCTQYHSLIRAVRLSGEIRNRRKNSR